MPPINKMQKLAREAETWTLILATFFSTCIALAGVILLYYDISASYFGWGKLAHTAVDIEEGAVILAIAVSVLPTLIQGVFIAFKRVGVDFITNDNMFLLVVGLTFIIDTSLDTARFYNGTGSSLAIGFVIAFFFFGICSEFCLSYFFPISVVLWGETLKRSNFTLVPMGTQSRGRQPQQPRSKQPQQQKQTPGRQPSRGRK